MKKRILLFSGSIILFSGLIASYQSGPASQGQNRTGTTGINNCSSGGCHNGGSYTNAGLNVSLADTSGIVDSWEPGHSYIITLSGTTSAPKYGFQLTSAWGMSNQPVGTFTALPGNTHVVSLGSYSILEHTSALTPTGTLIAVTGTWVAPTASTVDTVKFFATVNNVNGTGSILGDNSNNTVVKIGRNTTSVAQLNADVKINTYPNPITDQLNISLKNADNGLYTINVFDINGKVVSTQTATVGNTYETSINTSAWASGIYHLQLKKDGAQRTIKVIK